ncbi:hypothetical protein ACIBCN_43695 [Nocardia sp. NPDC051052]|uniref:hypothetical protein n=1 Tax=Nocardia sp. NPDC051052 TaxID=3364322 RepID=UPI0037B325CD
MGSHFWGACARVPGAHAGLAGAVVGDEGAVGAAGNDVVGEGDCGARVVGAAVLLGDDGVLLGVVVDDAGGGGLVVGSAVPDCAPATSNSTATPDTAVRNGIR